MLFKNSPEKFWNLIASKYAASPIKDPAAYATKIEKIKSLLASDNIVLDIGCGTGTQCMDLAGSVKHVTGADISDKLLAIAVQRKAERHLENVEFKNTSLFDACFKPESFDVVMAFYVLHFFEDIDAFMTRAHELLKPGGLLICETACLGETSKIIGNGIRFAGHLGVLPKINILTYAQIEQAMKIAGFNLIDKTKYGKPGTEYTLMARKI